jgi:hypothetical protein
MGRFLMTQAKIAWRDATAAHRDAAAKIEAATNSLSGNDSWKLDLHGLHASEVCYKSEAHLAATCMRSVH